MKYFASLFFSMMICTPLLLAQYSFTEMPTPFTGVVNSSIAFADINGDGHQDVLITGGINSYGAGSTQLYQNDGKGVFTALITPFESLSNSSVAFADVNGDSYPDVLTTGKTESSEYIARLYTNDGKGIFKEVATPFDGVDYGSVAFADVNGDNHQDVLITGESEGGYIAKLYQNNGRGTFTEIATPFEGVRTSSIAFADVNSDGDLDVLITGFSISKSTGITQLYENDGRGTFTEMSSPFEAVSNGSVAFADVNGDNYPDVLITGATSEESIAELYINDGKGIFTKSATSFQGVTRSSIAFADVNGDDYPDVLITGYAEPRGLITQLYENDGTGLFSRITMPFVPGVGSSSVDFADVDGDNRQDLLITGRTHSSYVAKLYKNNNKSIFDAIEEKD
ncbi:MAG: hypothetical protein ACI94Y_002090 [Maribacter sp.]|jgi:hypothetical protein